MQICAAVNLFPKDFQGYSLNISEYISARITFPLYFRSQHILLLLTRAVKLSGKRRYNRDLMAHEIKWITGGRWWCTQAWEPVMTYSDLPKNKGRRGRRRGKKKKNNRKTVEGFASGTSVFYDYEPSCRGKYRGRKCLRVLCL